MIVSTDSPESPSSRWQAVIELTYKMRKLAKGEEWVALAELELKRNRVMQESFSKPISPEESTQLRQTIEEILSIDQEVLEASLSAREMMSAHINKLSRSRLIQKAYTSNSA